MQEIIEFDVSASHHKNRRGTTMVVYALVDPRDGSVRYIGITNNLLHRFNEHMRFSGGNERKHAWLRELVDAHMLPIMHTLEVVAVYSQARDREIAWIQAYVESGATLLNDEICESVPEKNAASMSAESPDKLLMAIELLRRSPHATDEEIATALALKTKGVADSGSGKAGAGREVSQ